jgi:hypothetical protein
LGKEQTRISQKGFVFCQIHMKLGISEELFGKDFFSISANQKQEYCPWQPCFG